MKYFDSYHFALDRKNLFLLLRSTEKRTSECCMFFILFGILLIFAALLGEYGIMVEYEHKAPSWDGLNQPDRLTANYTSFICRDNGYYDEPCYLYFGDEAVDEGSSGGAWDGCSASLQALLNSETKMPYCNIVSTVAEMEAKLQTDDIVYPICKCADPSTFKNGTWARSENVAAAIEFEPNLSGAYTIYGPESRVQYFTGSTDEPDTNIQYNVNITSAASGLEKMYNPVVALQLAMDRALIGTKDIALSVEFFPQEAYSFTDMGFVTMLPLYITLLTMSGFLTITTEMAKESAEGLRHLLFTVGCSPFAYWFSWCRVMALRSIISIVPMLLICKGLILTQMDGFLLFLILLLYYIWAMLFSMLLVLCKVTPDSTSAMLVMIPALFASLSYAYTPYFEDPAFNMVISKPITILLAVFFPPFSMSMIAVIAMLFTYRGVSLNFDSSNEPADAFHDITLTHMILCLFANVIIFAALDYYLILVTSGISTKESSSGAANGVENSNFLTRDGNTDTEEGQGEVAVSIQNLTKTFARDDGGTFRAVDNLRVDFYKNQITSFLGHNGAGKSTTCALLTGELSPDSGDAFIHGHSIVSEMEKIRTLIGVCPQKNVIWDLLSPREHLQLYAKIRNVPTDQAVTQIKQLLNDIGLTDKADAFAKTLSGGQKRKLCTAIALVGDPSVVFLDEPTSGMDSNARRHMWDILFKYKGKDKAIVLCTHQMDEADILGDRVAILSAGQLQESGTPEYLKAKFGKGVRLDVSMNEGSNRMQLLQEISTAGACEAELDLDNVIDNDNERAVERDRILQSTAAGDVHFKVGLNADVAGALDALEKQRSLGLVEGFGITATNLEDVFWNLGEEAEVAKNGEKKQATQLPENLVFEKPGPLPKIYSMLVRHARSFRRDLLRHFRNNIGTFLYLCFGLFFYTFSFDFTRGDIVPVNLTNDAFIGMKQPFGVAWNGMDLPHDDVINKMSAWSAADSSLPIPVNATHVTPCLDAWLLDSDRTETCSLDRSPPVRTSSPNNDNRGDLGLAGAFEFDMHTHPRYEYSILTNQSVTLSLFGLISYANNAIWAAESDSSTRRLSMSYYGWPDENEAPTAIENHYRDLIAAFLTAIIGGLIFCMGISMMTGKLSMEVVDDQKNHIRQMTILMGVTKVEYALSYMIWDIMQALVMLAPLYIFCVSTGNSISLGATILALFLYFFAMVPIVHMISRAFEDSANSYMVIYYSLLVSFVGLYVCAQIWAGISQILADDDPAGDNYDEYLRNKEREELFLMWAQLHPVFALYECLTAIVYAQKFGYDPMQTRPEIFIINDPANNIENEEMNTTIRTARTPLGYLLYEGIFFFALYLLVEHFSEHPIFGKLDFIWFQMKQYICRCVCISPLYGPVSKYSRLQQIDSEDGDNIDIEQFSSSEIEDDDVRAEREAVTSVSPDEHSHDAIGVTMMEDPRRVHTSTSPIFDDGSIVMRDLRKQYHPTGMQQFEGTTAVRDLSLHILPKECFSLLGSNGAGKTSVMNMILRQARASSGNILIDGYNSRALPRSVITSMSYCPQHNCLFDTLTAKECLIFYCKIRGVPENLMEKYVTEWMTTADLLQHENTWCRNLSGGNKRKLSLAIALIGSPKIVILDEPTAGVDPTARRKLHWLINATKRRGATIVLTTHHIDEAASLGDRVGIMVKGYMCCLGTTQHLLHHYGEGYMLNAFMVAGCSIDEILLPKVKEICPSVSIRDRSGQQFGQLHLGDSKDFNIASLYRAMKQLQAENKVEYFTCGQARLEDVFLKLTNRFVKKRSDTEE